MKKYYFVGIGGSGMNPLAQIMRQRGNWVGGSDRNYDRGTTAALFEKLRQQGIHLFSQDGSGITPDIDAIVVSTAIEPHNVELQQARTLVIPVIHRSDLLADMFNHAFGIAIGGTSGKTTVTGMVAAILDCAGKDPTVINGGIMKQYATESRIGNAKGGSSGIMIIETDESDGSITKFHPRISVITNIAKDHKEIAELQRLFQIFADHTTDTLILNNDCPVTRSIAGSRVITFGMSASSDITIEPLQISASGIRFAALGATFQLNIPGMHNVYNAAAAIAVAVTLDIPVFAIQQGVAEFRGIQRRLELVSMINGIQVVDDFAHNPDKIAASIKTLKSMGERLTVIYQPHGYGPTRFLLDELAACFSVSLRPSDTLFLLPIFDAGGTADRSISSLDLAQKIRGPQVTCAPERNSVLEQVAACAQTGDVIAVMGARDDTLSSFAQALADTLRARPTR